MLKETVIRESFKYFKEALKEPMHAPTFRARDFSFFLQFVKPVWKTGALAFLLSIITTGLTTLLPLSSKVLIDFIIMKKGFEKLEKLLALFHIGHLSPAIRAFLESLELVAITILVLGFLIGLTGLIQRYFIMRFQKEITFNLQASLFEHLLSFPLSFFMKRETGYLAARISGDVYSLQYLFSSSIIELITKTSLVLFGIAILLSLSVKLTLLLLVIFPLYVLVNYFFSGRMRSTSLSEMEAAAQVSRDLHEVISGVETVKSHTTEMREAEKVSGTMRTAVHTGIIRSMVSILADFSVRGIQLLSTILILWFGAHEIMKRSITIGDYVAFTSYMVLLSGAVNALSTFHLRIQPLFASLDRLMELFRILPETGDVKAKPGKKLDIVSGEISFNGVSFEYERNVLVLKDISFSVKPGEIVALVGPSGAGKTTLINLLLKFYSPFAGNICLDGHDISTLDTDWIRRQIGIVSQDTFLFKETIENNIKYGNPFAKTEDVIGAARKAGIHDDIERLPGKYDTVIGERGFTLSAGQRQRISIARAFLKDPAIYIFDEPAASLDLITENLIKESLKELSGCKTTLIIAHRLSTIDLAHKIIVLSNGGIKEEGTHRELLNKKDLYYQLYSSHNTFR